VRLWDPSQGQGGKLGSCCSDPFSKARTLGKSWGHGPYSASQAKPPGSLSEKAQTNPSQELRASVSTLN
jgi:hypothetical protein